MDEYQGTITETIQIPRPMNILLISGSLRIERGSCFIAAMTSGRVTEARASCRVRTTNTTTSATAYAIDR